MSPASLLPHIVSGARVEKKWKSTAMRSVKAARKIHLRRVTIELKSCKKGFPQVL